MFDPFGDLHASGYLRNLEGVVDLRLVRLREQHFFEANLEKAMWYLGRVRGAVEYCHFLEVHHILFSRFYPWAGQDRLLMDVGRLVGKGVDVQFEVAELCQRAVERGLRIGNDPAAMRRQAGAVMGAFAWGHPFLKGNGRTMLLVHAELCRRAGFSIDWRSTQQELYLRALALELGAPGKHLDAYLEPFSFNAAAPATPYASQLSHASLASLTSPAPQGSLAALSGRSARHARQYQLQQQNVAYRHNDQNAIEGYCEMKRVRGEA